MISGVSNYYCKCFEKSGRYSGLFLARDLLLFVGVVTLVKLPTIRDCFNVRTVIIYYYCKPHTFFLRYDRNFIIRRDELNVSFGIVIAN